MAFWGVFWDYHKARLEYEERRLMIERGMAPPRNLLLGLGNLAYYGIARNRVPGEPL